MLRLCNRPARGGRSPAPGYAQAHGDPSTKVLEKIRRRLSSPELQHHFLQLFGSKLLTRVERIRSMEIKIDFFFIILIRLFSEQFNVFIF